MSIELSLNMRGVKTVPWRLGSDYRAFSYDLFDGLFDLREHIEVIAIFSERPGSGCLWRFFGMLGEVADGCAVDVVVVQIWNERLAKYLKVRGYKVERSAERGVFAVRKARIVAPVVSV